MTQLYKKHGRRYVPATLDDDWTGFMVICAVRYCLGRASYAPGRVNSFQNLRSVKLFVLT